jgi:hypothetical protein
LGAAKTNAVTNTFKKTYWFLWVYVVGFCLSWITQALFFRISGNRASLLAFALLRVEEFVRTSVNRWVGRGVVSFPPSPLAVSIVIAALLGGAAFVVAFAITQSTTRVLRWTGYAILCLLTFFTLFWPAIPRDLF